MTMETVCSWMLWLYIGTTYTGGTTNEQCKLILVNYMDCISDDTSLDYKWCNFEITGLQIEVMREATVLNTVHLMTGNCNFVNAIYQTYSDELWQGTNEHATNYSLYLDGKFRKKMEQLD